MARKKKRTSARKLTQLREQIATQRRRALRPTPPVNAQTRVSESLVERKRRLETKRRQRQEWEEL